MLQTSAFKVENPIVGITPSDVSGMSVKEFGTAVNVPQTPEFCIETATNESLHQMQAEGIRISMVLSLKAAPQQRESKATELVRQAKREALAKIQNNANGMAIRLASSSVNPAMQAAINSVLAQANSKAKGIMALLQMI